MTWGSGQVWSPDQFPKYFSCFAMLFLFTIKAWFFNHKPWKNKLWDKRGGLTFIRDRSLYNKVSYLQNIMSVSLWQFIIYISSVSLKFREFDITGQWIEFRVKNATICLHILCWHFFLFFVKKTCVFINFISFFFMKYHYFRNNILINQNPELVIRNYICSTIFVKK